jgi:hypothetical protein
MHHHSDSSGEALEFTHPVGNQAGGTDYQGRGIRLWRVHQQQGNDLKGFPQPHFVGKYQTARMPYGVPHPTDATRLVGKQRCRQARDRDFAVEILGSGSACLEKSLVGLDLHGCIGVTYKADCLAVGKIVGGRPTQHALEENGGISRKGPDRSSVHDPSMAIAGSTIHISVSSQQADTTKPRHSAVPSLANDHHGLDQALRKHETFR